MRGPALARYSLRTTLHHPSVGSTINHGTLPDRFIQPTNQVPTTSIRMKRILLAEDNQDNADLIRALLEPFYTVAVTQSASDAIQYLDTLSLADHPDLFLLDISLPGMDGTQLLRHLRADQRFRHIPAIAVTAHAMMNDRNRLLAVGFDEYVSKPVDEDQLVRAVEKLLATPS